jgi:hypothetical protein
MLVNTIFFSIYSMPSSSPPNTSYLLYVLAGYTGRILSPAIVWILIGLLWKSGRSWKSIVEGVFYGGAFVSITYLPQIFNYHPR